MCKIASLYFDKTSESVLQLAVPCNIALVLFIFAANGDDEGKPAARAVTALVWAFLGYSVAGLCAHFALVAALVASNGSLARIKVQGRRGAFVVARAVHSIVKAEAPGLCPEAVLRGGRQALALGRLQVAAPCRREHQRTRPGLRRCGTGPSRRRTTCAYASAVPGLQPGPVAAAAAERQRAGQPRPQPRHRHPPRRPPLRRRR